MILKMGKVRFVRMHKKEKKLMMQEEEKGFVRAVSLDRQEGLGSSVQRETSSTAREGKAGLMGTVIGGVGVEMVIGTREMILWQHVFS